ncbi:MAG: L-seryl-tRNA(Sec) selenium transferase [Acidobacteriota bacterium]
MSPESQILQQLPSVSKILQKESVQALINLYSREFVLEGIQECLDQLRAEIRSGQLSEQTLSERIAFLDSTVRSKLEARLSPSLRKVINASGVIIHPTVGRAPLSPTVAEAIEEIATGYSNLEYNLSVGKRGHRDLHFEERICALLGCEAATVCNNNAAAVLLILNTLALGKKVLVSRGELIEIGGSFRIPAIMERSGAILKEVGTTNKTKVSDYRDAVDRETALILRVHPSNYKIVGFTHRPQLPELVELARETKIPLAEDVGSGLLFPTSHPFLQEEPSVQAVLADGVDLVSFSGDKLLGGPQAGIIVGKKKLVDTIRRNPLMRACRVDKVTYSALEWTLIQYEKGTYEKTIPVHQMLCADAEEIKARAERVRDLLDSNVFRIEIKPGYSLIGGGSAPEEQIPTYLLAITSRKRSVNELERGLRESTVPIVARIEDDQLILDLRTVFPEQEDTIISAFAEIAAG